MSKLPTEKRIHKVSETDLKAHCKQEISLFTEQHSPLASVSHSEMFRCSPFLEEVRSQHEFHLLTYMVVALYRNHWMGKMQLPVTGGTTGKTTAGRVSNSGGQHLYVCFSCNRTLAISRRVHRFQKEK